MAPRRKSPGATCLKNSDNFDYLKSIGEFKKTVRRRESLRSSKSSKEYDLEQKISLEIKMREGSTKLLQACGAQSSKSTLPHALEAAKNLLTSNHRMAAYMGELQTRRKHSVKQEIKRSVGASKARVCLSDLRMPLIWKDSDHFKNKGDFRRFAVFALLKIGTEIYDTAMVNPVDRSMTDICFDDVITFNDIPPAFECEMELYGCVLHNDLSMASTPRKLRKSLHSSISRTVGRKLAASLKEDIQNPPSMGPRFELMGSARLTIEDVSTEIATYDLKIHCLEPRFNQLPLFGHFCCRLAAAPHANNKERLAALLTVQTSDVSQFNPHSTSTLRHMPSESPPPGVSHFVRVVGWLLEVWETEEEAKTSEHHPQTALSIDRYCDVNRESEVCLHLVNRGGIERGEMRLTFSEEETATAWFSQLTQVIEDHKCWGAAALEEMEILTPSHNRVPFMPLDNSRKGRFTSLYEETPLNDCSDGSSKSSSDDLYSSCSGSVLSGSSTLSSNSSTSSSFCPPSLPSMFIPSTPLPSSRSRAMTLSRASFRRWGSARYNIPFFRNI